VKAFSLSAVVAVLFLAGCGQAHVVQTHRPVLHLTAGDSGKVFTVKPHETIVLTLAFNRSPRYRWMFEPASQAMLGFRQLSQRYVPPKNGVPGAKGKEIWRYRPVGRGGANLGVFYGRLHRRPRPGHWSMARRFNVSIVTS
jgi:predicted secreted protein